MSTITVSPHSAVTNDVATQRSILLPKLIAAPFTPFHADGAINYSQIEKYADKLRRDGVSGIFICGTSGEGMSLTVEERKRLAETWKSAVGSRMKFIVHVGHVSLGEAQDLARHAQRLGADAIASIGSTFFSAAKPDSVVETCRRISMSASDTPFYYYHMPSMSRINFPAQVLMAGMIQRIPAFRGVKFTHEDFDDYSACLKEGGDQYEVFWGRDELLLSGLRMGAKGAVGSTYNFAAPLYLKMAEAYGAGNQAEAERLQEICTNGINCMIRFNGLVGIKETMRLAGVDCGPVRLPMTAMTTREIAQLEEGLEAMGFFQALNKVGK